MLVNCKALRLVALIGFAYLALVNASMVLNCCREGLTASDGGAVTESAE